MFSQPPSLSNPGLFITGTDTGVGKTVVTCAIAQVLRKKFGHVGVCKPIATGCRKEREGLVNDDAEALAHFADCRQPLDIINPIRYAAPLAPAVAARETECPPDYDRLAHCLGVLDRSSDVLLVEGVGGVLVPLDDRYTVLDLIVALGYPVAVVTRAGLGTLNHTAMTVQLLRQAGCRVAGLVINYSVSDPSDSSDLSLATNPKWLQEMNQTRILATLPTRSEGDVAVSEARLPPSIVDAIDSTYWPDVLEVSRIPGVGL